MINITLTKDNIHAYKKKYPITFYKLDQMVGDPKKEILISRIPEYNGWLQRHNYDNDVWFMERNKSKREW